MRKIISILSLFIFLTACNPLNKPYKEATVKEDLKELFDNKKISEDEARLLVFYIMREKAQSKNLEGRTYQELLGEAKKIRSELKGKVSSESEDEILEKEIIEEKNNEEKRQKMESVLAVAIYGKEYHAAYKHDYFEYKVAVENKSDKNIKKFGGWIVITDSMGTKLGDFHITEPWLGIPAHEIYRDTHEVDYDSTSKGDPVIRTTDLKNLRIVWNPHRIEFENGVVLE